MNRNEKRKKSGMAYVLGLLAFCVVSAQSSVVISSVCSSGVAEPPFLSYGVDPNVLLMIDNSASMYDLAYVETTGYCKDESYDLTGATSYQGYFDTTTWYMYDFTDGRFEPSVASACTGLQHSNSDVCLTLNTDTPTSTIFVATGNFLNWAASSKFDIQKSILTGGKNAIAASGYNMILESRGCSASRFVKEVQFTNGNFLTLGIRAPKDDVEKADADGNTTRIDIFGVSATGFEDNQCKEAITNLQDPKGQGLVSQPLQDCMGYDKDSPAYLADSNAAFNASIHNCWYLAKQDKFPTSVQNDINACENVYKGGALPASITPDDMAYVCSGVYDEDNYPAGVGYVGRCWKPEVLPAGCLIVPWDDPDMDSVDGVDPDGTTDDIPLQAQGKPYHDPFRGRDGYIYDCNGNFNANTGNCAGGTWKVRTYEKIAGSGACSSAVITPAGWAGTADDKETCVLDALKDYCGHLKLPEVVDPTDLVSGSSSEFWNLPAVLVDSGVVAQLNQPVVTLRGYVFQTEKPSGLIQDYAEEMRIGAMSFNANGSATEAPTNPNIATFVGDQDGSKLIQPLGKGDTHKDDLVAAINGVKADAWTPLAEAMLNAIGYYSQITADRRCHEDDFAVGTDPVQYYCQDNHVVMITDGASSADLHPYVKKMAIPDPATSPVSIDDDDEVGECKGTDLFGNEIQLLGSSTYFDDITYFGKKSTPEILYGAANAQKDGQDKKAITTHIIVSGTLRDTGINTECNPKVLMSNAAINGGTSLIEAPTPELVRSKLEQTFAGIRAGASAGSAASVISSSRGGEGAIYQAIFWPSKPSSTDSTVAVKWAGEVHSLFIDTNGYMYEDTDGDRKLTIPVSPDLGDKRVIIYFDNDLLISRGCYTTPVNGTCSDSVDLDSVRYLWSANDWLAKISNATFPPFDINDQDEYLNRTNYLSDERRRYIFTWNDLDNDGIVDPGETLPFVSKTVPGLATTDWAGKSVAADRRPVTNDFNAADNAEVNKIVEWIRGVEVDGLRSRTITKKMAGVSPDPQIVWRLGDVVHSTPTAVGRPMEGLHLLYGDTSYAKFVSRWANRRHMAYFGANDGMLHAVNGGFYNEDMKKFCLTANCTNETGVPELGAEMWAYVPYNLLPHLQCLTDPGYTHKFYVDQRPRVFDARIFAPDDIHPEGWGTVLVGSMRFGGARVKADSLSGNGADNRYFTSSYFVLDITNPEAPPVLLGEYTMLEDAGVDLGFTTPSPTPVVMKSDSGPGEWYLLMGSGPSTLEGNSTQKPKVAVFPLKWLTTEKKAFRIPDTTPTAANPSGVFTLDSPSNGFVSDMITVDYDLKANYMTDAVYFGTVEHGSDTTASTATYDDDWDGQLYRIVMRELNTNGEQVETKPHEWLPKSLFNAGQPITSAPTVGTDRYNYWVYFGTGRFFDKIDKADDAQQSFYGVKELKDCTGKFTWSTIAKGGLVDVSEILVKNAASADLAELYCLGTRGDLSSGNIANKTCLPSSDTDTLGSLITYIAGTSTTPGTSCVDTSSPLDGIVDVRTGKDGWYRDFPMVTRPRERNVGQATLLGGLLTFTTYQPFDDPCQQEGMAYLYGLYYQTGTAWYKTVFGARGLDGDRVMESISLGRGLATTPNLHVGSGDGPTAFIQTSTGEIIEIPQEPPIDNSKSGRQSWQER